MTTHDSAPAAPSRRAAVGNPEEVVTARLRTLSTALDGEPDPQFRAATRARLVAMAAVRQPAPAPKPWIRRVFERAEDRAPSVRRGRLTAGLTGAAVAVTAFATLIALSSGSHPGSALYALKRGTEQTQLALTSDSNRGTTLLGFASTRLHELQDMTQSGSSAAPAGGASPGAPSVLAAGPSTSLFLDTIATMNRQTTEGTYWVTTEALRTHDPAALTNLSAWARTQSAGLQALTPHLPQATQAAAGQALALVSGIQTRSGALSTSLTCPSGPATTAGDQLGPVPAACTGVATTPGQVTGTQGQPGGAATTPTPGATNGVPAPLPGGGTLPGTGGSATGGATGGAGGGGTTVPTLPTIPSGTTSGGGLPLPSLPIPGLLPGTKTSSSSSSGLLPSTSLPTCIPLVTC